jgi:hypothetical protein
MTNWAAASMCCNMGPRRDLYTAVGVRPQTRRTPQVVG